MEEIVTDGGQGGGEGSANPTWLSFQLWEFFCSQVFANLGTLAGSQVQKGKVVVFRSPLKTLDISQAIHLGQHCNSQQVPCSRLLE